MDRKRSLLWIIFLLVAMFLGPTVILRTMDSQENRLPSLRPGEHARLRMIIEQEKLMDAPSALRRSGDDARGELQRDAPASLPDPLREDSTDLDK